MKRGGGASFFALADLDRFLGLRTGTLATQARQNPEFKILDGHPEFKIMDCQNPEFKIGMPRSRIQDFERPKS